MGVLKDMPQDGAISVAKLASDTNVDEGLLGRYCTCCFVLQVEIDVPA
jgi:hypothetical protein